MSFDQRPARATKRVAASAIAPTSRLEAQSQSPVPAKSGIKGIILFVAAAMIGGIATTALFYGLIPGVPAFALPEISHR